MYLYKNSKGREITAHSYSAGNDWECQRRYFHHRVQGWSSREERVQLTFGQVVEAAIIWFHNHNREPQSGIDEFCRLWSHYESDTSLVYSEKTGDWRDHYFIGKEMLALYELTVHKLPIANEKFQLNYRKELFPDTEYAGLEFQAFIDCESEVSWDHPMLPSILFNGNLTRKVVIDYKTSAARYFEDPRLTLLDGQLRQYAWISQIDTVAFLVLIKNHSSISCGQKVVLLNKINNIEAGSEVIVIDADEANLIVLESEAIYDEYVEAKGKISGKGSTAAKEDLLVKYVLQHGFKVQRADVTKQRIQFLAAVIPPEDQYEAGEQVGREAIEIAQANINNFYPKKPGVRFPHAICQQCDCLGHCLGDKELVKQRLIQIGGDF